MRHNSSFELVQRIKSFINEFVGVQSSGSAEQSSQMVKRFVEVTCVNTPHEHLTTSLSLSLSLSLSQETESSLRDHPLWKDDTEEDFNWAVEALERFSDL